MSEESEFQTGQEIVTRKEIKPIKQRKWYSKILDPFNPLHKYQKENQKRLNA